jgi:hypothetical protein
MRADTNLQMFFYEVMNRMERGAQSGKVILEIQT